MKKYSMICICIAHILSGMDGYQPFNDDEELTDNTPHPVSTGAKETDQKNKSTAENQFENIPIANHERLQVNLTGTKTCTAARFTSVIQQCPKLHTLIFSQHSIMQLEDFGHRANTLQILRLDTGHLKAVSTVPLLLTTCPTLHTLSLQNNNITTLQETQIPSGHPLQYLYCNNNKIEEINFTKLCEKMKLLKYLDASDCPLQRFEVKNVPIDTKYIPYIKLHNTQLSDAMKVSILKNSLSVNKDIHLTSWLAGAPFGALGGMVSSMIPVVILKLSGLFVAGGVALGASIIGPVTAYAIVIGSTSPRHRETISYRVDFGQETNTAEIEVSTRFQYIVRHFPYFCSPYSSQENDTFQDESSTVSTNTDDI